MKKTIKVPRKSLNLMTRLPPKVRTLIRNFGFTLRVGPNPRAVKIEYDVPDHVDAAYFGEGVIWLRSTTKMKDSDITMACLHEIGHGILDFYRPYRTERQEEIMATAIALGFAAQYRLPVSKWFLREFSRYNRDIVKTKKTLKPMGNDPTYTISLETYQQKEPV